MKRHNKGYLLFSEKQRILGTHSEKYPIFFSFPTQSLFIFVHYLSEG